MTTVAVRSGMMACDSAWTDNNATVITLQSKIIHTKHNLLIGCAGDASDRDVIAMLMQIRSTADFPSLKDLRNAVQDKSDLSFLIYFPDRQIWCLEKTEDSITELLQIEQPYAAIGSGANFALTAMDLDCSAARAVEMACKRDRNSRPPVHCKSFRLSQKQRRR